MIISLNFPSSFLCAGSHLSPCPPGYAEAMHAPPPVRTPCPMQAADDGPGATVAGMKLQGSLSSASHLSLSLESPALATGEAASCFGWDPGYPQRAALGPARGTARRSGAHPSTRANTEVKQKQTGGKESALGPSLLQWCDRTCACL